MKIDVTPDLKDRIAKLPAKTRQIFEDLVQHANLARVYTTSLDGARAARVALPASSPKWLQAEADRILGTAETLWALRWPPFDEPAPLPLLEPDSLKFGELRRGWSFHVGGYGHPIKIFETVTDSAFHGEVVPYLVAGGWQPKTDTYGQATQYATKLDAMRAAHWQLCREMAGRLAASYKQMAEKEKEQ